MNRKIWGFTVIEVMVVITIISILSAVIYANFNDGTKISRDAERKNDLRNLQSAIEMYKKDNGVYPSGCNASSTWSGQRGSGVECASGNQYIVNLTPKYIPFLPNDPKLNPDVTNSGYMYVVNAAGNVYKLMAKNTVESEVVTYSSEFKSCDIVQPTWVPCGSTDIPADPATYDVVSDELDRCTVSSCEWSRRPAGGFDRPIPHCSSGNSQFRSSYAVWGGYANRAGILPTSANYEIYIERDTEDIICDIP